MPNDSTLTRDAVEALEQLRLLTTHCPDLIFINQDNRIVFVNEAGVRMLGAASAEQILGKTPHEFFHPSFHDQVNHRIQQLVEHNQVAGLSEQQMLRGDGSAFDVEVFAVPIQHHGKFAIQVVARDISSRKAAELGRMASEARFTGIISSAMDAIISINEQQEIVLFNPAAERMFGYRAEEILGKSLERLMPAGFRASHGAHIRQFGETGSTSRSMGALGTVKGLRQNGEEFSIEAAISQTLITGKKFYTVILRDITRRQLAEERLREQAALLDHAREAIITCDLSGRVLFWNHGAEQMYGWQTADVIGRNLRDELYHGDMAESEKATQKLYETGEWRGELRQFTKAGKEIIVEGHWVLLRNRAGEPQSFFIINTDITERKQLEAQFLRAQRMESIGTLAGGIAHDLNNILSPISMGLQMMQMKYADEYSQKMLGMMNVSVQRGAEMVKQILQFARGVSGERVALQLKHLLKDAFKILSETLPKSIVLKQHCAEDAALVLGDVTQLHQVLLNLCVNARDAMPAGGTLTVSLENQTVPDGFSALVREAKPGLYAVLTVSDTGSGIQPEHLERIFDPFFTTKEHGKGTGLGLSTVFGIVRAHSGFITVNSTVGKGTTFKVYLPALSAEPVKPVETKVDVTPYGQGELVLVVDDEAAIREMHRAALEAYDYRVLTANDGAAALSLYDRHHNAIQLVLTDLEMPVMDGAALVRSLRSVNPALPIIICSGSSNTEGRAAIETLGIKTILAKPLNVQTLLHALAAALHQKA